MPPVKGRGRGGSKAAASAAAVAKLRKQSCAPGAGSKTATADKPQNGEKNPTTASKRGGKAGTTAGSKESKAAPAPTESKESKPAPAPSGSKESKAAPAPTGSKQYKAASAPTGKKQSKVAPAPTGSKQSKAAPAPTGSKESKAAPAPTEAKPPAKRKQSTAALGFDRTASKTAGTTIGRKKSRADITQGTKASTGTSAARRKSTVGAGAVGSDIPADKAAPTGTKVSGEHGKEEPLSDVDLMSSDHKPHGHGTETVQRGQHFGKFFFVLVACAFFATVGWAMVSFLHIEWRHVDDAMACRSPECKAASEYLQKLLFQDKDPCADFYGRVCGKWSRKDTGFHIDSWTAALTIMNASMFQVGGVLGREDVLRGMHILKPLYRKCYRYMSAVTDLKEEMAQGEKAMSVSELMHATSFMAIVRYLVRLALRVGIFGLFDVRFVRVGDQSVLQLRRGYSLHEKLGASLEVGDARYRITKLLSIWLEKENVSSETDTLFRLDAEVKRIFSKSAPQTLKPLEEVTSGMMDLTAEQWAAAVNEAHSESALKLKPSDKVVDTDMTSVHEASRYLVGEGVNLTAFYVATNIEADLIFVVYTKLELTTNQLQQASFCMFLVRKCVSLTWPPLAAQMLLKEADSVPILESLYTSLQETAKESHVLAWVDESARADAASDIANVTLSVVTTALPVGSRANYTGPAKPLREDEHGFIHTYVRARRHQCDVALRSPPSMDELIIFGLEEAGHVSFADALNSVVVPTLSQMEPLLYTNGVPEQYNYGTMGSLLAARLVEALVSAGESGKSIWYTATRARREKTLECLVGRHHRQGFGRKVAGSSQSQRNTMLALSSGVRLAYAALEALFQAQVANARAVRENWPLIQEVFFVRFCLLWCSGTSTPKPITPNEMCLLPLYNMKEFGELYKCTGRTNYSAAGDTCDV